MLAWYYDGLTTTASRTWLTVRSDDRVLVRLRGDEIAGFVRFADVLGKMYDKGRWHTFSLRYNGERWGFSFLRGITLINFQGTSGEFEHELHAGDLQEVAAWFAGRDDAGDGLGEVSIRGTTLHVKRHGDELRLSVPDGNLAGLAALLRRGAAVAVSRLPLPPFRSGHMAYNLATGNGSGWSELTFTQDGFHTILPLGKPSLIRIAEALEGAAARCVEAGHP